jgi:4-hydroxymandelate synthase
MAALDVDYIEFYAEDKQSAVDYLVSSLDFTPMAEATDLGKNSTLLQQGSVQLVVTGGPQTEDFLHAHGDGVADIALACDDVAATRDAAAKAGAAVTVSAAGYPIVSGFGSTCHTLVELPAASGAWLPAGRAWITAREARTRPDGRIRLLDHVAICLEGETLVGYADFYQDALGLARYSAEYVEVGDQAMDSIVVRSRSGGVTFTLLEPDLTRQAGQLDAFLSRNGGPGVQHLAFGVDDIISSVRDFRDRGVQFLSTPTTYYQMLSERLPGIRAEIARLRSADVLADRDEWGYLLQLFTRSPYERNTMFYELIQRRGARGFGSANIRALYEAVERDRLAAE